MKAHDRDTGSEALRAAKLSLWSVLLPAAAFTLLPLVATFGSMGAASWLTWLQMASLVTVVTLVGEPYRRSRSAAIGSVNYWPGDVWLVAAVLLLHPVQAVTLMVVAISGQYCVGVGRVAWRELLVELTLCSVAVTLLIPVAEVVRPRWLAVGLAPLGELLTMVCVLAGLMTMLGLDARPAVSSPSSWIVSSAAAVTGVGVAGLVNWYGWVGAAGALVPLVLLTQLSVSRHVLRFDEVDRLTGLVRHGPWQARVLAAQHAGRRGMVFYVAVAKNSAGLGADLEALISVAHWLTQHADPDEILGRRQDCLLLFSECPASEARTFARRLENHLLTALDVEVFVTWARPSQTTAIARDPAPRKVPMPSHH